jgi:hypothetical protein
MKRIILTATALVLALTLCACSNGKNQISNDGLSFSDLSGLTFWHGSGVGGWFTELSISPDGSFSGNFHDSEMGSFGDDYPHGTLYVCKFSGKFASLTKIDGYEYSMRCESLTLDDPPGLEEIVDGMKIITSDPAGFGNANEFYLYLPGKKKDELPAQFLEWVWMAIDEDDDALTFYGLYNAGGEAGFIGDDG